MAAVDRRIAPDGNRLPITAAIRVRSLELRNSSNVPLNVYDNFNVPIFSLPANSQAITPYASQNLAVQTVGAGAGDVLVRLHDTTITPSGLIGPPIPTTPPAPPPPLPLPPAPIVIGFSSLSGQVTVDWLPVPDPSQINGYHVRMNLDIVETVGPSITSATITGLTNGTAYSFSVSAFNATGEGPSVDYSYVTPRPSIPWNPISGSAAQSLANIAGQFPDNYPLGATPLWTTTGAVYASVPGTGYVLRSGSGFALINPQAAGDRTVSWALFQTNAATAALVIANEPNNELYLSLPNTVGVPMISVIQVVGGVSVVLTSLGPNYVAGTWTYWVSVIVRGSTANIFASISGPSTYYVNQSIAFYPSLQVANSFGFALSLAQPTAPYAQALTAFGFSSP